MVAYPQPLPKGKGVKKSLPSGGDLEEAEDLGEASLS